MEQNLPSLEKDGSRITNLISAKFHEDLNVNLHDACSSAHLSLKMGGTRRVTLFIALLACGLSNCQVAVAPPSLAQELASVVVPPGLIPARVESGTPSVTGDHSSPAHYGGCSENEVPVVENGVLQAASRAKAAAGELSYQCLPGFQNDAGDKWTVKVACQFDPTSANFGWKVNGACIPLKQEPKCDTVPSPPFNARLPELDSVGGTLKFVPGARIYFECEEMFVTTAQDGVTPPFSECTHQGSWTPAMHGCRLEKQMAADAVTKEQEALKSSKERHIRYFHVDDPSAGEAESEAERMEHDAVIDRFVHLTNAKGLPHNEDLHRMVHHGPAANIAGGDIENDFLVPANVAFKKIAPGGDDLIQVPMMQNKAQLRREERTLLALLRKQDEVLHPKRTGFRFGSNCMSASGSLIAGCMKGFGEEFLLSAAKTGPKSKKATVRRMRENGVDYTDSEWADLYDSPPNSATRVDSDAEATESEGAVVGDVYGDGPKPGYHVAVRNTDGRFEMMPNNPPRLHKYHSTVKADIDRRIRHAHMLGGDDRIVKTPRPRQEHNPYYVLILVFGTFGLMVGGAACLINQYGLLDMDSCPPAGDDVTSATEKTTNAGDSEKDECGKPWWDFC